VREVKYKIYCLMNYENNSFGIDIVMAILDKGEPYLDFMKALELQMNDEFIEEMGKKEEEKQYFLSSYYNTSYSQQYSNMDKICKIREMSICDEDDEDIIVKKYEDDYDI